MNESVEEFLRPAGKVVALSNLKIAAARETASACADHPRFRVLEARALDDDGRCSEILVVECENDGVPTNAPVDIRYREQFGLRFFAKPAPPQVLILRASFPSVPHLNQARGDKHRSLCLYFEPWEATRISWTPRRFLERILWWLAETAIKRLHRGDQPVERLYYPFSYQLFLDKEVSQLQQRPNSRIDVHALKGPSGSLDRFIGQVVDSGAAANGSAVSFLAFDVGGIVHGDHEAYPENLGELADQLNTRGGNFLAGIERAIEQRCNGSPIPLGTESDLGMLVLGLPMQREVGVAAERKDIQAFLFKGGIGKLGAAFGWLTKDAKRGFLYTPAVGGSGPQSNDWRKLQISPVEVIEGLTESRIRQIAGVTPATATFTGVLAGVGALGSALLNLWSRQAWGQWVLFDDDYVRPHNTIRHEARVDAVGFNKVDVMRVLANSTHQARDAVTAAYSTQFASEGEAELQNASLLVDATTSLDVPRAISREAKAPRSASIFLTPNANASVLMLEDRDRTLRLDQIEPQYYRAVVNEDWGRHHLEGNLSEFWVGAGCRDISATISPENIQIHSALLSRRLRSSVDLPDAALLVHHTEADGLIQSLRTNLRPSWRREFGDWTVLIDEGLLDAARKIRRGALPSETGGVLLGSVDHYRRTIAMISALKPPPDSEGTPASFERGTQDLKETIAEANRRTAGIARYVGEWHSHPPRAPALMSGDDLHQLLHLAIHLASDGDPAVMLIIGDNDWSLYVGRAIA